MKTDREEEKFDKEILEEEPEQEELQFGYGASAIFLIFLLFVIYISVSR